MTVEKDVKLEVLDWVIRAMRPNELWRRILCTSRRTIEELYQPFMKEIHGKKNWLTWATKFWHFLNPSAFPIQDSRVDSFFSLSAPDPVTKYERLVSELEAFNDQHAQWLPRLRSIDAGHAWNDVKLWDKVFYAIGERNDATRKARRQSAS
ncbi:MAG: hypothetical protein ACREPM_02675 [Gemmatimonadaceae bacterium]